MVNMIDKHEAGWTDALFVDGPLASAPQGVHRYALFDCAFAPDCQQIIQEELATAQWRSLYANAPGAADEVIAHSPILVTIDEIERPVVDRLMPKTDGLPMLSFLRSTESLDPLAERLSRWCVVHADGQHFVLRFPDTRRLPDVLSVLTPDQLAEFCGSGTAWHFRGRDAQWRTFTAPEASSALALAPAFATSPKLDGKQCATLIAASEADEIVAGLLYLTPRYGDQHAASVLNAMARRALEMAGHLGLTTPTQRMNLCELLWQRPALADTPDRSVESLRALIA